MSDSSENISASHLSPEWNFIFKSISVKKNKNISGLDMQKLNWSRIRVLAYRHGILPLMYAWLKDFPHIHLPSEELNHLRMIHLRNVGQNLILVQHLFQILDLLADRGIKILTYKGPVLAMRAYGDLCRRQYVDLDFLVKGEEFILLYQELTRSGYKPLLPLTDRMKSQWSRSGREYIFVKDKILIDVHFRISEGPAFFKTQNTFWKNSDTIKMNSHQVPVLSIEDSLLMLTVHGSKHCWQLLKWVADVAHLVASHPEIEWDRVIINSKQIGCLTMLGIGLGLAGKICKLDLPPEVDGELLQSPRIKRFVKHFFDQLVSGDFQIKKFQKRIIPVRTLDSFPKKIRYIGYYAFTPKFKDLKTFSLPSSLYFLYYLIRPVRLFFSIFVIPFKYLFKS